VRFPLDYYRILGVPSQSTPDQVEQAFQDRLQQRPHHQHSSVAINGRQQLLEKAFATLSKPALRQAYDNNFFDGAGAPGSVGLSAAMAKAATSLGGRSAATLPKLETGIEIEDHQFAGALLILHELGEYDKVVELGTPEIARSTEPKSPHVSLALSQSDVCLSVALSHLELGREAWQQGHYEAAATDLQTGLDLLMNEGLFAVVQNQIRTDLARLRPYRILELLAAPLEDTTTRRQGLVMLRAMLQERNGIDGNGDDQSGS
jgi:curved DNA-binding protein CbpA